MCVCALIASTAQAQVEVTVGGYGLGLFADSDSQGVGFTTESDIEYVSGRLTADNGLTFGGAVDLDDADPRFQFSGTADNGLRYGYNFDLDDVSGSDVDIDEAFVFISGDFGRVVFGDDDPAEGTGAYVTCDGYVGVGEKPRYVSPSFEGFQFGAGYISDVENKRGALAKEDPGLINPAFSLDGTLSGYSASASGTVCADYFNLPTYISLGADYYKLSGNGEVLNINQPNFGVTGVGVAPGAFVNSPTDITRADYWSDRWGSSATVQFDEPLFMGFSGLYGMDEVLPSNSSLSFVKGFRGGALNQTDRFDINTDTPAFGGNSASTIRYDTNFQGAFGGVYAGLSVDHSQLLKNGNVLTTSLTATGGYDWYHFNVSDSVNATGLGGALNVVQSKDLSYDVGTPTASVSARVGYDIGNVTFFGSAGVDFGKNPSIEYQRPDSAPGPVTLNPTLSLGWDTSYQVRGGFIFDSW